MTSTTQRDTTCCGSKHRWWCRGAAWD